ncbi:hypothetical protein Tco_0371016 [Tanacetum coccineum]
MRPAEALTVIQTMADHSQKWYDGATSKKMESSNSSDGLVALVNKLDNLGRDTKKLKQSVHTIQVGCQICEGPHLNKDCPLSKEKKIEEGPIPGMRPVDALTAIQTMADHSQKWHDDLTSINIGSSSSKDGLAALVNKLDNLG